MAASPMQIIGYTIIYFSFAIGWASLLARLYCRVFILKKWNTDDYLAIGVVLASCGQQVILHMFLARGGGLRMDALRDGQFYDILEILFVEEIYYFSFHFLIKLAFLIFYSRLSISRTFRTFVYIGMGTNSAIFITTITLACLQCIPFDEILHPGTHPDAICIDTLVIFLVPSILNILQDFYIFILPIIMVLGLQMSPRRKIAVIAVISFGGVAVLLAILRLIPVLELNTNSDTSYVLGKMIIVTALEIQLAVVALNLPALKALWVRWTGGSSNGSGNVNTPENGYKLSSMSKKIVGSSNVHSGFDSRTQRQKSSRGTVTRLEQDIIDNDSEEVLFQCTSSSEGIQRAAEHDEGIMVTTDVNINHRERD